MGVRFLIGRAGVGKTRLCAEQLWGELAAAPLGGPLLWITPEQGTFTAERMLLTGGTARGAFRVRTLSFARLAMLIAREAGWISDERGASSRMLDDVARVVMLEEIVRAHRSELVAFRGVADRPGFIRKLDSALRELQQLGQSSGSLTDLVDSGTAAKAGGDAAVRRFRDLSLLLRHWGETLEKRDVWDSERILHRAAMFAEEGGAERVLGSEFRQSQAWVDGFSALSYLEIRLLVAVVKRASTVTIALLGDPDSPGIQEKRGGIEEGGLFARTERLYRRLLDEFRRHSVRVDGTAPMREQRRFASAGLVHVEEMLAGPMQSPVTEFVGTLFDASPQPSAEGGVDIWECSDPETEVRAAAQRIRRLVALEGYRFREIGIIVPELGDGKGGGYGDAVRRIFSAHGIAHFVDERRSISHHPVVELLRSAVAVWRGGWNSDDVLLFLKCGLAGVPEAEISLTENYVLAHDIAHGGWDREWPWLDVEPGGDRELLEESRRRLERVNAVRATLVQRLALPRGFGEREAAGERYVAWLRGMLEELGVGERVAEWVAAARAQAKQGAKAEHGAAELALIHEQAWSGVLETLQALEDLVRGRTLDWDAFERVLSTALETMTLGLIPPTVDQVLVSSVVRSRVPQLRVVMILGAVEGAFPKVVEEDVILPDAQRALLEEGDGAGFGGGERATLEMAFFDYLAMTRASDRLVLTYPIADRRGKALVRSRYIERLHVEIPDDVAEHVFDRTSGRGLEAVATIGDVVAAGAVWAREQLRRAGEGREIILAAESGGDLYEWVAREKDDAVAAMRTLAWEALRTNEGPYLSEQLAARFYPAGQALRMSVSELEKYAACPLQYFMHYTLGLKPRQILALEAVDMGRLYHRILERVYARIISGELAWPECGEAALLAVMQMEVDAACREMHGELAEKLAGYEKQRTRAKRVLAVILEADRRRAEVGDLRPAGVEIKFGEARELQGGGAGKLVKLPVLRVEMTNGRRLEVKGKIDRVDADPDGGDRAAIMDYKSGGERKIEMGKVFFGIELQLPLYAVVIRELAKRAPMAALYIPMGLRRKMLKAGEAAAAMGTDAFYQKMQSVRGVIEQEGAGLLDRAVAAEGTGESDWFSMGYTKKGEPLKRSDMISHEQFELVLDYARWKAGALAEELVRGGIGPAPWRQGAGAACDWCDFTSMCPFDRAAGSYREIPKMSRDDALAAMAEALRNA